MYVWTSVFHQDKSAIPHTSILKSTKQPVQQEQVNQKNSKYFGVILNFKKSWKN